MKAREEINENDEPLAVGKISMKRNLELVRDILLYFDEREEISVIRSDEVEIQGYDRHEIDYHLRIMYQGGFLNGEPLISGSSSRLYDVCPSELTWAGHEFLDAIRDNQDWSDVKKVGAGVSGFTISLVRDVALAYAKSKIQEKTGVEF